jgi:hypothetical protein
MASVRVRLLGRERVPRRELTPAFSVVRYGCYVGWCVSSYGVAGQAGIYIL